MTTRPRHLVLALLISVLTLDAASAQNEPPTRQDGRDRQSNPAWDEIDAGRLRDRLENRRQELIEAERQISAAIESLDAGSEPREVVAALMQNGAWMMRELRGPESGPTDMIDGRQPERRRGPRTANAEPPTEAQRAEIVAFASEHLPELARRLERRGDRSNSRSWTHISGRLQKLMDLWEKDQPLAKLEIEQMRLAVQVSRAARQYRDVQKTGTESDAIAARNALTEALTRQFDNRTAIMEHEITRLAERISDIRGKLDPLMEQRAAIVEEKADLLILKDKQADQRPD